MKRISISFLFMAMLLLPWLSHAQLVQEVTLSAATNGQTMTVPPEGLRVYPEKVTGTNNYTRGIDYSLSIVSSCANTDTTVLYFTFQSFDVGPFDTVFIYDGPDTRSPLLIKCNNFYHNPGSRQFFTSINNASRTLTIRFKTASSGTPYVGWSLAMDCGKPCEDLVPTIDSVFYKVRNGQIIDSGRIANQIGHIDTIYRVIDSANHIYDSNTIVRFDTFFFPGINLCVGDQVIFNGHGEFSQNTGIYFPSDDNVTYQWRFGVSDDSLCMVGARSVPYSGYTDVGCFPLTLSFLDERGCKSNTTATVTIRTSPNPLKTIYDLATICTTDSLYVSVGYDGDNATLTLRMIEYAQMKSKTNAVKTFIPDGPQAFNQGCATSKCYSATVVFDDFPIGRTVQTAEDICSICVNYEHSFMGDYTLSIICPSNQKAVLKYQTNNDATQAGAPSNAGGGGMHYTGLPYGGNDHGTWDNTTAAGLCDSTYNMYGVGWTYCFSRNKDYTLVNGGLPCNTNQPGNYYLSVGPQVSVTHTFDPIPPHFQQAANAGTKTFETTDSSNHAEHSNYYLPATDFHELVGCPLNGTWQIEICDEYGVDNGWVFHWSLDICGVSSDDDCRYQVGIDSVAWGPDTAGGRNYDIYNGKYRGLQSKPISQTESWMMSPDTSGTFPVNIRLYDEFGCVWDTNTRIHIVRTPTPNLGPDSMICGDKFVVLDAKDYWINDSLHDGYTYRWDPYGQTTDTIHTTAIIGSTTLYAVEVIHTEHNKRCMGRDTVNVGVSVQPIPNFDPGKYPLEGCEPFTVEIDNATLNASKYHWDFGDGYTTSEKNPKHTYSTGTYDFKFYAYSNEGCVDSIVYPELVTVYPSPDARFSWEPAYPTVSQPYVQLINQTTPDNPDFQYFWEIQYDKDYPYSYHTLPTKDTNFIWETNGRDISGDYIVRLITRSYNLGPSGNIVYCADTSENTILLINDFLQFPNVVTPNGDGINDRFVIINLVSGQAYPTNRLDIYNKWGAKVFSKENISSDEDFWDPNATNSPDGTYFFRFSAHGYNGAVERNGAIEVLR